MSACSTRVGPRPMPSPTDRSASVVTSIPFAAVVDDRARPCRRPCADVPTRRNIAAARMCRSARREDATTPLPGVRCLRRRARTSARLGFRRRSTTQTKEFWMSSTSTAGRGMFRRPVEGGSNLDGMGDASPKTNPTLLGEMTMEALGSGIIAIFGTGVVAAVVTAKIGDHDSIAWAWGLGVTFGIFVAAKTTGAHLNPAVTLAVALFKGFPKNRHPPVHRRAGDRLGPRRAHHQARLRRTDRRDRSGAHPCDAGHLLDVTRQRRQRAARLGRAGLLRPGRRHRGPAVPDLRGHRPARSEPLPRAHRHRGRPDHRRHRFRARYRRRLRDQPGP